MAFKEEEMIKMTEILYMHEHLDFSPTMPYFKKELEKQMYLNESNEGAIF